MKKILLFYFSGTGNTKWVVQKMASHLTALGNKVVLASCEEEVNLGQEVYDAEVIGIAFPIYGSFAPILFQRFLDQLPCFENKPLFALTCAGYAAGDVLWHTVKPLRKKGYVPFLLGNFMMGNNLHLPILSPLHVTGPEKMVRKLRRAHVKVEHLAKLIDKGKTHMEGRDPFGKLLGMSQRGVIEKFVGRCFGGFSVQSCIQCGWCVKNCPVQNIEFSDSGVKFLNHCMLCMRCYNFCDDKAIQMTHKTKNLEKYKRFKGPEGKGRRSI